jgi:putative DNA primase/helicase
VAPQPPPESDLVEPTAATSGKRPNAATRIADLARDLSTELIFDGEHAYVVVQQPTHVRCLPIHSRAFRRWIAAALRRSGQNIPSGDALKMAELALTGLAEERGVSPTPTIRVAGRDGIIYLDLGDDDWRCVRVSPGRWDLVQHPLEGPYLYRPPRMAALPEPVQGGSVEALWQFVNVPREEDRKLLLVWMLQALWPRGPYPTLVFYGEQGSAKTSAMSAVKALVDPTRTTATSNAPTEPAGPPREVRDIAAAAYGRHVLAFDNVSYIDQWLGDALCRLATGSEIANRQLYSNYDEEGFSAIRPVMLSAVPDVVAQSDLADRSIKIRLEPPARRVEERDLWRSFEKARPQIFGALLDLLAGALANYNRAQVPQIDVRMADFARLGEAAGIVLGWPQGEFTQTYAANRSDAARELAQTDPVFEPLGDLLDESDGVWTGTLTALLSELNTRIELHERGRGWPSNARGLSSYLERLKPSLRAAGITLERLGRSGREGVRYQIWRGDA